MHFRIILRTDQHGNNSAAGQITNNMCPTGDDRSESGSPNHIVVLLLFNAAPATADVGRDEATFER
jgi:hypothetical protein